MKLIDRAYKILTGFESKDEFDKFKRSIKIFESSTSDRKIYACETDAEKMLGRHDLFDSAILANKRFAYNFVKMAILGAASAASLGFGNIISFFGFLQMSVRAYNIGQDSKEIEQRAYELLILNPGRPDHGSSDTRPDDLVSNFIVSNDFFVRSCKSPIRPLERLLSRPGWEAMEHLASKSAFVCGAQFAGYAFFSAAAYKTGHGVATAFMLKEMTASAYSGIFYSRIARRARTIALATALGNAAYDRHNLMIGRE